MKIITPRRSLATFTSLAVLGMVATSSIARGQGGGMANPAFRVAPALTQQQVGFNTPVLGQTYMPAPATGGYAGPYAGPGGGLPNSMSMTSYGPGSSYQGYGQPVQSYPMTNYGGDPYGGYMQGAAGVITAQGNFMIAKEQRNVLREQVRRMRMDNRRRAIDDYLYERSVLPTLEDDRERLNTIALKRSRNDPPLTEIWSGASLNELLNALIKRQGQGYRGSQVGLDEEILRHINLTSGKDGANAGVLKPLAEGKSVSWPLGIFNLQPKRDADDLRVQVDSLLKQAVEQIQGNRLDAGVLRELVNDVRLLSDVVVRNVSELPPTEYIEAKRFINDLSDAVRVLRQPDAAKYLNKRYTAKAGNVSDLVTFMEKEGLQFAPAVSGDEAAYTALQRALVAYDSTFQGQLATSDQPASK